MNPALPSLALDLDARRIAATAATIAVHVLALMLLLAPLESAPPKFVEETVITVEEWKKPLPPPPPPPPPQPPRPITERPPVDVPQARLPDPPPVISTETWDNAIALTEYADEPAELDIETVMPTGPVALTVLFGPAPPYPGHLQRMGVTGRVVLRIEVDASGHPVSGRIENSSGNRLLDKSALDWVVRKWRFEPAQHAGQAIASTALVPIIYSLQ